MRGSGFPTPRWLPWLRPLTSDAPGALAPPSCHLVEPQSRTNTEAATSAVSFAFPLCPSITLARPPSSFSQIMATASSWFLLALPSL